MTEILIVYSYIRDSLTLLMHMPSNSGVLCEYIPVTCFLYHGSGSILKYHNIIGLVLCI